MVSFHEVFPLPHEHQTRIMEECIAKDLSKDVSYIHTSFGKFLFNL